MDKRSVATPNVSPAVVGRSARLQSLRARHILLAETEAAPGRVRFLSMPVVLAEGAKSTWVTVTRTGRFTDPRYGEFEITPTMLGQMVANFDRRVLGQDVFLDVAHKPSDGAAARFVKLAVENGRLRALAEWTEFGQEAVRKRGFTYLSAEYHENWRDNEKGAEHGCVLLGAGLTTRPVIKHMDRVELSEADPDDDAPPKLAVHPQLRKHLEQDTMNKHLQALLARLITLGLTDAQAQPIIQAATKPMEAAGEDEAKALALVESFYAAGQAMHAEIKKLAAAGTGGAVTLAPTFTIGGGVDQAAVNAAVTKALADAQAARAAEASAVEAKVKLLSDTITADKAISEDQAKKVLDEMRGLITKELSDDQVRQLATFALNTLKSGSAAAQLALLGYRPASGSVRIELDGSGEVKALQATVDKRLGLDDSAAAARRFERTGGKLLEHNKAFAEKALAQFDELHGARLLQEHKLLAGGTGQIGDFAVPAVFERTVIREALYQMLGLSFVDMGTVGFAPVIQIPYSYRDTTAAGANSTRVYEMQAIQRAGVIQTYEEARPIPQKLAFKLSNEMRYLLGGAPIDFDPLAENVRNIIRIVSEDTDRLIHNELLDANDQALTAAGNDTLTAQVNGTNKIFVLNNWPVVRPKKVYDLKGVQQGSTLYPITVTLNGTARSEYTGGTLSAGLYWVMDYNLGEIRFVNEAGVLQTPTSGWALVVTYTYTQNVAKFSLDVGASPDTIGAVYDRLLTSIGGRKVVVENDRFYMANMTLMSGAVDNALGQATTFTANGSRSGTGLNADGSVGQVKGMPNFNTKTPGVNMGDVRLLVGERGNTRFRMMRPFQMGNLEQARDGSGFFVGAQENYGEQFIVIHTPSQRRNATSSVVLYSAAGRVARAA